MTAFATLAAAERRLYLDQVATRLGVVPVIVESPVPSGSCLPMLVRRSWLVITLT